MGYLELHFNPELFNCKDIDKFMSEVESIIESLKLSEDDSWIEKYKMDIVFGIVKIKDRIYYHSIKDTDYIHYLPLRLSFIDEGYFKCITIEYVLEKELKELHKNWKSFYIHI